MPERPLLLFPSPESVVRLKGSGFPPNTHAPTNKKGQARRIDEMFANVLSAFVSDEPGDIERVLVMETSSQIDGLQNAVRRIQGLEWLAEIDVDDIELHDLYDAETGKKVKGGRFYVLSSNKSATDELLKLWSKHQAGQRLRYGLGKFKDLFVFLLTLRRWSVSDRLRDTGILDLLKEEYQAKKGTQSEIDFEIELHFWTSEVRRVRSFQEVVQRIESAGGSIGQSICMEEIAFHALKATLPINSVDRLMHHDWDLGEPTSELPPVFHSESVKYFRPIGQHIDRAGEIYEDPLEVHLKPIESDETPVLALLDGAPFQYHQFLDNRIAFDDPDNLHEKYEISQQKHGTAMASLICHGDLGMGQTEIRSHSRRIYARPVLQPHSYFSRNKEVMPPTVFQEDLIEIAVREMFEGDSPPAQNVKVINLSLGNLSQQYLHEMSPWARLLDWLSFKYKVLFIVSAGNFEDCIRLNERENTSNPVSFCRSDVLCEIDRNQRHHRLLSPAESLNALTVGALQEDSSGSLPLSVRGFDPIEDYPLPSPYSRVGPGYRGAIKPDIYVGGGRLLYDRDPSDESILVPVTNTNGPPGVRVAYPGSRSEILTNTSYQAGSSHATAIVTHNAGHIFETLEEIRAEYPSLPSSHDAVLIKTLLVHGTSWRQNAFAYDHLKNSTNKRKFSKYLARYLGFGSLQAERLHECTQTRATAIGYGDIEDGQRHRFTFPLPNGSNVRDFLRLTVTLTWFTPINPFHIGIRRAKLLLAGNGLKSDNGHIRQNCDGQQVRKGTVQHEIFELRKSNLPGDVLELFVECTADAGALDEEIPYGLAVTLEVAEEEDINLYAMVRERIRPRVGVATDRT